MLSYGEGIYINVLVKDIVTLNTAALLHGLKWIYGGTIFIAVCYFTCYAFTGNILTGKDSSSLFSSQQCK